MTTWEQNIWKVIITNLLKLFFKSALTFSNVMIDLLGKRTLEINVLYIMDSVCFWWNAIYHSSENINFRILGFIWYLFKKQASLEERVFRCKSYSTLSGIYYSHLLCFLPHYMHLYYDISIVPPSLNCKIFHVREPYIFISRSSGSNKIPDIH